MPNFEKQYDKKCQIDQEFYSFRHPSGVRLSIMDEKIHLAHVQRLGGSDAQWRYHTVTTPENSS